MTLPKLRPEIKALWLAALRSGEYQQGREYLHYLAADGTEKFCCLGVLCDLAVKRGVAVDVEWLDNHPEAVNNEPDVVIPFKYDGSIVMPTSAVMHWAYQEPSRDFAWKVERTDDDEDDPERHIYSLAELNDDHGQSFTQIANLIEESL